MTSNVYGYVPYAGSLQSGDASPQISHPITLWMAIMLLGLYGISGREASEKCLERAGFDQSKDGSRVGMVSLPSIPTLFNLRRTRLRCFGDNRHENAHQSRESGQPGSIPGARITLRGGCDQDGI